MLQLEPTDRQHGALLSPSFRVRACGARIASRTDELREEDVGTGAGLFEVKLIGDEYFTFVTECKDPKACTILLRGASKEILAVRTTRGSAAPFTLLHPLLCYTATWTSILSPLSGVFSFFSTSQCCSSQSDLRGEPMRGSGPDCGLSL